MNSCTCIAKQHSFIRSCHVTGACHGIVSSDNVVQVVAGAPTAACRSQTSGTISRLQHASQRSRRRLGKHSGRLSAAQFQYLMLLPKSRNGRLIKQSLSRSKQVKAPQGEAVLLKLVECQRKKAASLPPGTRNETWQLAASVWYIPSAVSWRSCGLFVLASCMQQPILYHSALPPVGEARSL